MSTSLPPRGTVSEVSEPLHLTVVFEDGGEGWVTATIPEVQGVVSQGRTREEARENVRDALREVLLYRLGVPAEKTELTDASEPLDLIIA